MVWVSIVELLVSLTKELVSRRLEFMDSLSLGLEIVASLEAPTIKAH